MRIVLLAAAAACLSTPALAADFDAGPLRGTQYAPPAVTPIANWEGAYFGGFAGYTQGDFQFTDGTRTVVGNHLRSTLLESEHKVSGLLNLGSSDARTGSYGAFVGYNVQFDEAVLGFEVDFTRARLSVSGSDQIARGLSTSNGFTNVVALTGQAEGELQDYGTLRARAGYTYGSFMPYVTAGLAIARTSLNQTVGVQTFGFDVAAQRQAVETFIDTGVVTPVPNYGYVPGSFDPLTGRGTPAAPVLLTSRKRSTVIGYAGGLGVDMALTPNFFLRGEYQFVHFNSFAGQALTINAIRGSAGIKF